MFPRELKRYDSYRYCWKANNREEIRDYQTIPMQLYQGDGYLYTCALPVRGCHNERAYLDQKLHQVIHSLNKGSEFLHHTYLTKLSMCVSNYRMPLSKM